MKGRARATGEGVARKRWSEFIKAWNEEAARHGGPRIATLAMLARAESVPLLDDQSVHRLQIGFYESLIEDLDPLAERGFNYSRDQRNRARKKGVLNDLLFLLVTAPQYSEYTNKELWEELPSVAERHDMVMRENDSGEYEWDVIATGQAGKMSFRSFQTRVAQIRRQTGKLKRGRKNKSA